jgi:hypothetical protein
MQRGAYNKKELPQYRIEQLDSIGFDWNPRGNKWTDMYEQLKAFKEVVSICIIMHLKILLMTLMMCDLQNSMDTVTFQR